MRFRLLAVALLAWCAFGERTARAQVASSHVVNDGAPAPRGGLDHAQALPEQERALRGHIVALRDQRERLRQLGRQEYWLRRRVLGFVGIGVGGLGLLATGIALVSRGGPPGPHSGPPHEFTSGERIGLPLSFALSSALVGLGLWSLVSANQGHRYVAHMRSLDVQLERDRLALKNVRRHRKQLTPLSLRPVFERRQVWSFAIAWVR